MNVISYQKERDYLNLSYDLGWTSHTFTFVFELLYFQQL